ncbi:hypothetical protein JCGZ_05687 [Jatropha curcas]|uniref:Homeobox domain-containing protein n=1 Tax=Jatropha curcas TaxID=180498 RepID=A0A067LI26_JATCU|nr:WUSCHEL-related homeobox 2 [Jatropha curcas]KDP44220.1 hypothetical protein JCGZ_05687 [Jatropha curcas]
MESENIEMGNSGSGAQVNSRWNPTKEQISLLEGLYRQGIRTPTADQIQQITARLKAFGHIEGKNVFYWFQNHKARQRQKQKQEIMGYNNINRYLHKPHQPMFASPCTNVVCGSYYLPQIDLGFCPPYSKVLLPGSFKRKPRTEKIDQKARTYACCAGYEPVMTQEYHNKNISGNNYVNNQETLPLFPLQPTGVLQGKAMITASSSSSSFSEISPDGVEENTDGKLPFFDFFSVKGSL